MTLEQAFKFLEAKEAGKRSALAFLIHKVLKPPLARTIAERMPM